jgi:transglutaminase-like putative cysteine protease
MHDEAAMTAAPDTSTARGEDRTFHVEIGYGVVDDARLCVAIAPAIGAGLVLEEHLEITTSSGPCPVDEITSPHGGRIHVFRGHVGEVAITYDARLRGHVRPLEDGVGEFDLLLYGRPSRYCPSDHLGGFAIGEFGLDRPPLDRVVAIVEWITNRVSYLAGSSSVHDSAEDTLLTGVGTCRDFAHLGIALCRAIDIPARFCSVYAPGLSPMDFHAVFEAYAEGRWWVFDATHHAPRQSMTRIATGRDAADCAFATVLEGLAELESLTVRAIVDEVLLTTDGGEPVELP